MSNVPGDRTIFFLGWLEFPTILWLKALKRYALCVTATFPQFFSFAFYIIITIIITDRLALMSDFLTRNFRLDYMYHYW